MTDAYDAAYEEICALAHARASEAREHALRNQIREMIREFMPGNMVGAIEIALTEQTEAIIELVRDHDREEA